MKEELSKIDAGVETSMKGKIDSENKIMEFEMNFKAHLKGETPQLELIKDVAIPLISKR